MEQTIDYQHQFAKSTEAYHIQLLELKVNDFRVIPTLEP